jgi:pimeloyl-ACP methyl ester carboxylesterase
MTGSNTVSTGEYTFDVTQAGTKGCPLILCLHGFPQTNHTWRHQLPYLASQGYYCVAPHQRGYSPGARPAGINEYATSLLVNDMLVLIDKLGYDQAHIVGHDWGGQISWLMAANHPDRVSSLTVLSRPHPAAFSWAMAMDAQQSARSKHHQAFQNPDSAKLLLEDDARRLRRLFTDQGVAGEDAARYLSVLGNEGALDAAINWYRTRVDGSALVGDNVPAVRVPTLYLWGAEDSSVGRLAAFKTAEFVEASFELVEIPDVGHFITDQVVDIVNTSILGHIGNV